MSGATIWGVYRERTHSPGRENDDEAILDAVAVRLGSTARGEVRTLDPQELLEHAPDGGLPDLVFYMCEAEDVLERLTRWQDQGVTLVNPVQGVRSTLRTETVRLLDREPYFPRSRFIATDATAPTLDGRHWVKRGDYHAVCADDVVEVRSNEALEAALVQFRARGIARVVVQDHVEGDLIKFYGVRDHASDRPLWFKWFYHQGQTLAHHPVDELRLRQTCMRGAALLGLEVFGGDVIVTAAGELIAIDFNAWPSFALYRDEAAERIAALLESRVERTTPAFGVPTGEKVATR